MKPIFIQTINSDIPIINIIETIFPKEIKNQNMDSFK